MRSEQRPPRARPRPNDGAGYGYAGRPLPPRRAGSARYGYQMDDGGSATGGRMAAVFLALAVAALVITQGLWQVTAPGASGRVLRGILPQLTDLDQTIAANLESLREVARGQPQDGSVTMPGLPVAVTVTRREAEADPTTLRTTLLQRMSAALYEQGASAFLAPGATAPSPTLLSSRWALQRSLEFLTAEQHDTLRLPRLIAAVATLVLAVLTIWLLEGPSRLSGPGVSLIVGSVIGGLFAGGIRLGALAFYGSDTVADSIVRLVARDTANTLFYVAGAFFVFGLVLTLLGRLAGRLDRAQPAVPAATGQRPPPGSLSGGGC